MFEEEMEICDSTKIAPLNVTSAVHGCSAVAAVPVPQFVLLPVNSMKIISAGRFKNSNL